MILENKTRRLARRPHRRAMTNSLRSIGGGWDGCLLSVVKRIRFLYGTYILRNDAGIVNGRALSLSTRQTDLVQDVLCRHQNCSWLVLPHLVVIAAAKLGMNVALRSRKEMLRTSSWSPLLTPFAKASFCQFHP